MIEIKMTCDASGCYRDTILEDDHDIDVYNAGWHSDPLTEDQHYCPTCWPKVKHEFDSQPQHRVTTTVD